ncbi:hypothetical protein [Aquamicrobium defluvii]|uniref:hypothetical protein n=1 Tax=Aquamicrobium defluvii TaxID=69279 RepID=UPI00105B4ADC|nr:hypothetical protein [Aquamicrobium defluvii]
MADDIGRVLRSALSISVNRGNASILSFHAIPDTKPLGTFAGIALPSPRLPMGAARRSVCSRRTSDRNGHQSSGQINSRSAFSNRLPCTGSDESRITLLPEELKAAGIPTNAACVAPASFPGRIHATSDDSG